MVLLDNVGLELVNGEKLKKEGISNYQETSAGLEEEAFMEAVNVTLHEVKDEVVIEDFDDDNMSFDLNETTTSFFVHGDQDDPAQQQDESVCDSRPPANDENNESIVVEPSHIVVNVKSTRSRRSCSKRSFETRDTVEEDELKTEVKVNSKREEDLDDKEFVPSDDEVELHAEADDEDFIPPSSKRRKRAHRSRAHRSRAEVDMSERPIPCREEGCTRRFGSELLMEGHYQKKHLGI
jgi:hypothetical protein